MGIKIQDIQIGDIFSETSRYIVQNIESNVISFRHVGTGKIVTLTNDYVRELLTSADQYETEIKVGLEDKFWTAAKIKAAKNLPPDVKEGDLQVPGIRTVWSKIGNQVFAVCFEKKPKELSEKEYRQALADYDAKAVERLEKAKNSKKGVVNAALEILQEQRENPVLRTEPPELRELRGVKVQFESTTGFYTVVDLDLKEVEPANHRQLNINAIQWLVVDGVKYVKE